MNLEINKKVIKMLHKVVDDIREVSLQMVGLSPKPLPGLLVWDIMEEMVTTGK